jgi:hypothetical protein
VARILTKANSAATNNPFKATRMSAAKILSRGRLLPEPLLGGLRAGAPPFEGRAGTRCLAELHRPKIYQPVRVTKPIDYLS